MSPDEPLDVEALRAALGGQCLGRRILVREEATSTNDIVAEMAREQSEGLVVFAEQQTAGRGQYGRQWESAARKGLWFSVLLRPQITVSDSPRLTALLAQVIASTLAESLDLSATIKPPNDIYIGAAKVAGILVEMRVESSGTYCAIAGIGLNVNHATDDFPDELRETATSLALATGRSIDRTALAINLLRKLDECYAAAAL